MPDSSDYRKIIRTLIETLKPKTYLEVGCRKGETLRYILNASKKTKLYAIDINDVSKFIPSSVKFFCGNSHEVGKNWNIPLDMVFIDADHCAESVLKDFELYSKWVSPNGIILLHDTYPSSVEMTNKSENGDAYKVAWMIRMERNDAFEIVTIPVVNGLSIIRKCTKQTHWS